MSFDNNPSDNGDDYFSETRMSFGDHIEDLRFHLIRAILGFAVAMIISFPLAYYVMGFMTHPIREKLLEFYQRQADRKLEEMKKTPDKFKDILAERDSTIHLNLTVVAQKLGVKVPNLKETFVAIPIKIKPTPEDIKALTNSALVARPGEMLIAITIQETLIVWLQIAIATGLVIGSPWIFYQIWAFIAAGLYPHEKKVINRYLPVAVFLFVGGVLFCYFIVIPRAIDAMLLFNEWLNVSPQLRLSEWMSFAIWVPVIFGLSFETPLVMMMLNFLGIATPETFRKFRKFAIMGMAIGAALLTPTPDALTMMYLLVPMILFYELGIILCRYGPKRRLFDLDMPEEEEMIEV